MGAYAPSGPVRAARALIPVSRKPGKRAVDGRAAPGR